MAGIPQELIAKINLKLTGEIVLKKLGVDFANVGIEETTIRCFCPIHKESIFRSLAIDNKQQKYKCAYTLCPGYKGGTLFDLFCLTAKIPVTTAVLIWAKEFNLEAELPPTEELIKDAISHAESLNKSGNQTGAIQEYQKILEFVSTEWQLWHRIIELYQEDNKNDIAAEQGYRAAKIAADQKNYDQAISFLVTTTGLQPENFPAAELLADLYLKQNQTEKAAEIWQQHLSSYLKHNNIAAAINTVEKLMEVFPNQIQWKQQAVSLYPRVNETGKTLRLLEHLLSEYHQQKNVTEVISVLTQLTTLAPTELKWSKELADAYLAAGDIEKTVPLLQLMAKELAGRGKISEALQLLNQAYLADSDNLSILEQRIELLISIKNYKDAIPLMMYLADKHMQQNQLDKSIEIYTRASLLLPGKIELRQKLISAYLQSGKNQAALDQYQQLAKYYIEKQEFETAAKTYQEMLSLSPSDISLRSSLAELYEQTKSHAKAIEQYLEIAKQQEDRTEFDAAIDTYKKIIGIDADHLLARTKLADVYYATKQTKLATETKLAVAQIYQRLKKYTESTKIAREILAQDKNNIKALSLVLEFYQKKSWRVRIPAIYHRLAIAYLQLQNMNLAANMLRHVLEFTPENTKVLSQLSETLVNLKAIPEAKKIYMQLGANYETKSQPQLAISTYQRIISLDRMDVAAAESLVRVEQEWYYRRPDIVSLSQLTEHSLLLAKIYLQKKLYDPAEKLGRQLLQIAPDEVQIYRLLADIYREIGQKEAAIEMFMQLAEVLTLKDQPESAAEEYQRILQLDSGHIAARQKLIETYLALKKEPEATNELLQLTEQYRALQDFAGAIATYEQILKLQPDNIQHLSHLAALYQENQQPKQALAIYTRLSNIYQEKGETDGVAEIYRDMVTVEPENTERREKLAQFYLKSGMIHEALLEYDALATLFAQKGEFSEAIRIFLIMMNLDPNNLQIRTVIAEMYERMGSYSEAVAQYMAIAQTYLQTGKTDAAVDMYHRAIPLDPENTMLLETLANLEKTTKKKSSAIETYHRLAKVYLEKEKPNKAKAVFQTILELDRENVDSYSQLIKLALAENKKKDAVQYYQSLGNIFARRKAIQEAITAYQAAIALQPEELSLRQELIDILLNQKLNEQAALQYQEIATIYTRKGKSADAIAAYRNASNLDPGNISIRLALIDAQLQQGLELELIDDYIAVADLYTKQGDIATAKTYYEKVLQLDPTNFNAISRIRHLP